VKIKEKEENKVIHINIDNKQTCSGSRTKGKVEKIEKLSNNLIKILLFEFLNA